MYRRSAAWKSKVRVSAGLRWGETPLLVYTSRLVLVASGVTEGGGERSRVSFLADINPITGSHPQGLAPQYRSPGGWCCYV